MSGRNVVDYLIIGSGAAGAATALQLRGKQVLVVDVGYTFKEQSLPSSPLMSLLKEGKPIFPQLIGNSFQALNNISNSYMSPKLKGPLMRFITQKPDCFAADETDEFQAVMSFALGGLANAWGAGVFRFTDEELAPFPYSASDLAPYYDTLTRHIGISGEDDDLTYHFGSTVGLQPPLPLSPVSAEFLKCYQKHKSLFSRHGCSVGRLRSSILTRTHEGRPPYKVTGQDFFQPNNPSIYHPGYTFEQLLREKSIEYVSGCVALRYQELDDVVAVEFQNIADNSRRTLYARKLLIAAGALNSARLVLASAGDYESRLPLLDNPVSYVPFIIPWRIGTAYDPDAFSGGELALSYRGGVAYPRAIQGTFYNLNAPLRSDLLTEFPLSLQGNLAAAKYLLPALAMVQMFYPDTPQPENYIQLKKDGGLILKYRSPSLGSFEGYLIKMMVRLGYLSLPFLCKYPAPGSSIHYAGGLPMRKNPQHRYETDIDGRLFGTKNIHIMDAATFPELPSKNLTFTIMANAMRIAARLS